MNDPLAAYRDALSLSPAGSPAGVLPNGVPVFTGVSAAGPGWTTVITPTGETIRREGTRAWRNNNPGNIEFGQFAQRYGAVGTDGRFAVFPTYEQGRAAKEALLFESPSYSGRTIASAINRYAPPSENNTNRYIEEVSRSIGVSADTPLSSLTPQQRQIMLDAMERVEGFRPGSSAPSTGGASFVSAPSQSNMPAPSERASTMNNAQPGMMPFSATGQDQQPFYRNPDFWDTLAIGLGGMSTRPNEAIIGAAQGRMQERQQSRREAEQRNQTLQWLASQGRDDLVAAVSAGLPITDAMNIALAPTPGPERGVVVGRNVVDPVTGRVIYEGPQVDDTSSAEQEINRLMEIGLTREDAIRVTQLYIVSRDPITGETIIIDKLTGRPVQYNPLVQPGEITTTPLPPALPEAETPSGEAVAPTSEFGPQYPDATSAFGLPGFARWGANVLTGTVGRPMFPNAQQSTAGFAVLRESLLNDISAAYNRQPPSWLMENIQALTPKAASPFVGVDQAISQLDALGNNFLTELSSLQSQTQQSLSPTDRAAVNQRIQAVQTGLSRIREARLSLLQGQSPAQTDEDFEAMLDRYAQ